MKIQKAYFTVPEVLARWGIAESDLIYLAENDRLRLSVRVFDLPMEFGEFDETPEGEPFRVPTKRTKYRGLLDLDSAEAFRIYRCGETEISRVSVPEAAYAELQDDEPGLFVTIGDLLIRRDERDRFEAEMASTGGDATSATFSASPDYRDVHCDGARFRLGVVQAQVVRVLHEAALAGNPWQDGKTVLRDAGSKSLKMSDVFKSKTNWQHLIRSDGRGHFRLHLRSDSARKRR